MTIVEKAKRTIERHKMLLRGDTLLVGVSGGPDSIALLYLLMDIRDECGFALRVAHLNHGFRKEAAGEAEFVGKVAASLGLPVSIRSIDVPSIMEMEGLSAQEAARDVRYAFFEEEAREAGARRVALAHTADDQAETVLMRLLRGSGPLGLSGIPPVRGIFVRPLIECTRKEIEDYLYERNIPFVTDSSNLKMDYMRNRVRMELLPFLESYNPNIRKVLSRAAEIAHIDNQFIEIESDKFYLEKMVRDSEQQDNITIEMDGFKELHQAISSRVIRKAIMVVKGDLKRISFQHISDILGLINTGEGRWSLHLPDVTVSREHDRLIFNREKGRR